MKMYNDSKNWVYYLNRPFDLFGCSLWYNWYRAYVKRLTNIKQYDSLFIEESHNLTKRYYVREQMRAFEQGIAQFVHEKPKECKEMLKNALQLNQQARIYLKKGVNAFPDFESAVHFYNGLAIHGTILPFFTLRALTELKIKDAEIEKLCEEIRSVSLYPEVLKTILIPIAIQRFALHGKKITPEELEVLLLDEVLNWDVSHLAQRMQARKEGKYFVYEVIGEKETVKWIKNPQAVIDAVEKTKLDKNVTEIKGQIAFKGKVQGIARIVTTFDGKGTMFNQGDILITLNSNPHLMHLIKKAAAIVSDMGGVGCHAAIVSRELKIPCVMGTQIATKVLKDGDLVEVDAEKGIVRILKE